jgi:hypothetical protein
MKPGDPEAGKRNVRRITAVGRGRGEAVLMTFNEWFRAKRLKGSYWLYIVFDPLNRPSPRPVTVRDPAEAFRRVARRYDKYRVVVIPAEAVESYG